MTELIPIRSLTPERVREAIEDALENGGVETPDTTILADFLAAIDWSGPETETAALAATVGTLIAAVTDYAEGDSSAASYVECLTGVLARLDEERATSVSRQDGSGSTQPLFRASLTAATSRTFSRTRSNNAWAAGGVAGGTRITVG